MTKLWKVAKRPQVPEKRREMMWKKQKGRCSINGCRMTLERDLPHSATVEHHIPLSMGGARGGDNISLACARCNNAKSCTPPPDAPHWVQHRHKEKLRPRKLANPPPDGVPGWRNDG